MQLPHKIILEAVQQRWASKQAKGFFTKLFELGEIKALSIIVVQTETYDEKTRMCSDEIINRWKYDHSGLQPLSVNIDLSREQADYCYYCIDEEKKRIIMNWETIFPCASTRKHLHYNSFGAIYEIVEEEGVEVFKVIRTWIV